MDTVIYWIGILLKLILSIALLRVIVWGVFWAIEKLYGIVISISGWSLLLPGFRSLMIKTTNLELHLNDLRFTVRGLDPTCRHLIKINVSGIHVEYYRRNTGDRGGGPGVVGTRSGRGTSPAPPARHKAKDGPSFRRRVGYWCLSRLLLLLEVSVKCLEAVVEDTLTPTTTLIGMLQVTGHLGVIAKPLRNHELGISVDIDRASGRYYLQSDRPCSTTDDGLYPLGEIDVSTKIRLFLRPLVKVRKGLVQSIQINAIPLSITLLHEDLPVYLVQHLLSFSPGQRRGKRVSQVEAQANHSHESLPEFEVVLEEINVFCHASASNRVLSGKLTRVSAAAKFSSEERNRQNSEKENLLCFVSTIGVQGLSATDSLGRKCFTLKQILLHIEKSSNVLSNQLQVSSVHASLWDGEAVFWTKYFTRNLQRTRAKLRALFSSRRGEVVDRTRETAGSAVSMLFALPVSVVTTVEASDWSVQVRMDAPSLQSKRPILRGVMAACVGNIQWSPVENNTSSVRASVRVSDTYLHIPGFHPTFNDPVFFEQRVDDPSILPSLHKHLWGRVASLGCLTLQLEKKLHLKHSSPDTLSSLHAKEEAKEAGEIERIKESTSVDFSDEPMVLSGEGRSFMLEWSKPTVVTLAKVIEHCQREHRELFNKLLPSSAPSSSSTPSVSAVRDTPLFAVGLQFQLRDVNVFMYGLLPEPPSLMLRLDAASLTAPSTPSPSHTFSLELHDLLLDDLRLPTWDEPFLCSSVSNLPRGVGVAVANTLSLKYDHQIKSVELDVDKVNVNWTTTVHCCLFHVATYLLGDVKLLRGVVMSGQEKDPLPTTTTTPPAPEVICVGDCAKALLAKIPLSLTLTLQTVEGVANIDQGARVSLELKNSKVELSGGILQGHCLESSVTFDLHTIVQLHKVLARFPHTLPASEPEEGQEEGGVTGRRRFKTQLSQEENEIINLQLSRLELIFPYNYKFSETFDKVMNIKKYLQMLHSTPGMGSEREGPEGEGGVRGPLILPPDMLLECDHLLLQLCEDPFEAKLRANYELMCDEHEQKTQRLRALQHKIEEVKKKYGEYAMSGQDVQNFYDSLEMKDSEIYCQRARKLYSSPESLLRTSLFQFSMTGTKILAVFDPSMLGRERLAECIKEIDSISVWPEGAYHFSTLWGGYVHGETQKLMMQIRDYPCPLIDISDIGISGRIVLAEQEAQEREKRSAVVQVGHPWKDATVQRKLPPLKYYYDFEMTSTAWDMMHGSSLEAGLAQTSNGFNLLTTPTVDPSRPLAYWDKLRLLFHGTIHLRTEEMRIILPTTFNPYNSVEYLELRMTTLDLSLLTNSKLTLEGAVQLLVHTTSKYDECELFNFPQALGTINLLWVCGGRDPNRHHHVTRCAPDRLPVRPDKQEHDSYSSFRSHNLDVELELVVRPQASKDAPLPLVLLYSSTLRCLQQYQMLLKWNVTRPTKRGKLFKNVRSWPRRPPLLRHWRNVKISVSFPKTMFHYWSSQALQRGVECSLDKADLSISLTLTLVPVDSDLVQRHRANWTISSFSGCGEGINAHIKRSAEPQDLTEASALKMEDDFVFVEFGKDHVSSKLLSIEKITYSRQASAKPKQEESTESDSKEYTHKLEATNTRLLWNTSNRNVVFRLYDAFKQAQELKRYLSTEALKSILSKKDLEKNELEEMSTPAGTDNKSNLASPTLGSPQAVPRVKRHSSSGNTMLDQLLMDISNTYVKYVDERAPTDPQLKGVAAVNMDDITSSNWLISLINTQVVLQGVEQQGYVVASSHVANVFGCDHEPKMKNGVYVSKKSWVGKLQELQYFTTQSVKEELEHVPWLPLSVIRPPGTASEGMNSSDKRQVDGEANLNALLGTLGPSGGSQRPATPLGEAMGGTVGSMRLDDSCEGDGENAAELANQPTIQLQRVAPRCHCQVIYVTYGDQVEAEITRSSSPGSVSPRAGSLNSSNDVDTFTFRYPSVEVCTTSYQYALLMDILNNLLLSKELKRKEAMDGHAHMRFSLQLSNKVKDPRKAVLSQQNKVKKCLQAVREAETALFLEERQETTSPASQDVLKELESRLALAKEELSAASMKLSILVKTFRQSQLYLAPTRAANITVPSDPTRRIEIWLDDAHWSLMDSDGQLQLADICLTNFSYTRLTFSDDSGEHRLELGTFKVQNLMPNTSPIYQQVLVPYDPKEKHLRVDKNVTLRVYLKDKAPVAGISVKEHLEVNVVPLTVSLTSRFFQTMQDFFFPKAEDTTDMGEPDHTHLFGPTGVQPSPHYGDVPDGNSPLLSRGGSKRSTVSISSGNFATSSTVSANTSPPLSSPGIQKKKKTIDDVEKMKDRATKTITFIYVKIPQTALCITYKSENVSLKDLQNQRVIVPTLEYHNQNRTWTDMLMEMKKDYKHVIVQQTIKSAIGMKAPDDVAGLVSPKTKRHSHHGDILLYNPQVAQSKSGKGKKLFGRLGSKDSDEESLKSVSSGASYQPPLTEPDINLKRTVRNITKIAQSEHKSD